MDGFKTPPLADFTSYSKLLGQQGGHLATINQWAGSQCSNTAGLEGLLALISGLVPDVARFFEDKISQCQRGMTLVSGKVDATAKAYRGSDADTAGQLRSLYPTALSGFPDIGALPGTSLVGNFRDEDVTLKPDLTSAAEDEHKSMSHMMLTMRTSLGEGMLAGAQKLFKFCTGQSLIELLLDPLVGDFGRLEYLHDAYSALSDAIYTVTGTLRKGSWALGSEWTGSAATAFDSYLFSWSMGMGGIGDAAKAVAGVYHDAYESIIALVRLALHKIGDLINDDVKKLADLAAQTATADAAIEVAGGGPEDPIADIGAALTTGVEMYRMYKVVNRIVTAVNAIEGTYHAIQDVLNGIPKAVEFIQDQINSPMPTLGSLIDDVEQRGFEFEKNQGWSSTLGAARIAMLPAA